MKLRRRLLTQSFTVLMSTVLVTACISLIFGFFYSKMNHMPVGNSSTQTNLIVMRESEVIYASENFSATLVQEIRMQLEMGHDRITIN